MVEGAEVDFSRALTYPFACSKNKSLWHGHSLKEVDKNMIHQRILLLAVCGLTLGLTAPSGWAETGDPAKGEAIFEGLCGACHGPKGKGDGPAGEMMKPPAADLTGSKLKDKPDAELFQTIQNGRPPTAMSAFKRKLSDQQIHDVVAYIRSLGK
jgi:mono/diheme cytochrome c family protein